MVLKPLQPPKARHQAGANRLSLAFALGRELPGCGPRRWEGSGRLGADWSQQLLSEWRQRLPPLAREASSCCRCWEQQTHRVSKEVGIAAVLQQLYSSLRCSTSEGFRSVSHFYPLSQSSNTPFNTDTNGAVSVAMTQVSSMHASFG